MAWRQLPRRLASAYLPLVLIMASPPLALAQWRSPAGMRSVHGNGYRWGIGYLWGNGYDYVSRYAAMETDMDFVRAMAMAMAGVTAGMEAWAVARIRVGAGGVAVLPPSGGSARWQRMRSSGAL